VAEIFRALTNRLRDSTWTIVFKGLIIVHLMIREGEPEVTLKYLAQNPSRKLAINHFTEGMSVILLGLEIMIRHRCGFGGYNMKGHCRGWELEWGTGHS